LHASCGNVSLKLNNVTVLVGRNDVGKTNLLELIHMLSRPSDLARIAFLNNKRVTSPLGNSLKFLFRNGKNEDHVIKGRVKGFRTSSEFSFEF